MAALRKPRPKVGQITYWLADYASLLRDPSFEALYTAHFKEMFPPKMGRKLALDHGRYSRLSAMGMLKCFAVRKDDALIGYASYLVMPTLHHGPDWVVAINDVTFIHPDHRTGMVAVKFLKHTEGWLRKQKVSVIYHHDPHRRSIAKLFERLGYSPLQTTFEKVL